MKQLQNNFTTPEQSKRLLGLGVPASSADCYYRAIGFGSGFDKLPNICGGAKFLGAIDMPCWSVGRLLEVFAKCKMFGEENKMKPLQLYADEINGGFVDFLIDIFENYGDLDFSKLDD